jgi:hypothetical protein
MVVTHARADRMKSNRYNCEVNGGIPLTKRARPARVPSTGLRVLGTGTLSQEFCGPTRKPVQGVSVTLRRKNLRVSATVSGTVTV